MTQSSLFGRGFWRSRFFLEEVLPYSRWMASGHGEANTLGLKVTPERLEMLLKWEWPCCACGKLMHPIRTRVVRTHDGRTKSSSPYVAVACPPDASPGCSRGALAQDAFSQLKGIAS